MAHPPVSSFQHYEPEIKYTGPVKTSGGALDLSHLSCYVPKADPLTSKEQMTLSPVDFSGGWKREKLTRLGYYHPLEPCHVSFPKAQLEQMLARLTDCLRMLSCRVSYEDDWLAAACKTMEQVEFQVSFFEDRKDAQVVLLELQRRCGDSYTFHQDYVQPILAVVQGKPAPDRPHMALGMDVDLDRLLEQHAEKVTDDDVTIAIELATNLVTNDRVDARRLGVESLETLTDTAKTGMSTARKVARVLVLPTDEASQKLVHILLRYLLECKEDDGDIGFQVLQVWSNAWQVAADDMECPLESFCDMNCPPDALVKSLMSRVEQVREQPHEATLAVRGLDALCREMPQLLSEVSWQAVENAKSLGEAENAALEHACGKFLEAR